MKGYTLFCLLYIGKKECISNPNPPLYIYAGKSVGVHSFHPDECGGRWGMEEGGEGARKECSRGSA